MGLSTAPTDERGFSIVLIIVLDGSLVWKYTDDGGIAFSVQLLEWVRNGATPGKLSARVVDGTMTGTFTADGILGLTGFHRSGTFAGTPMVAEGP
jgi:hypothetical protein